MWGVVSCHSCWQPDGLDVSGKLSMSLRPRPLDARPHRIHHTCELWNRLLMATVVMSFYGLLSYYYILLSCQTSHRTSHRRAKERPRASHVVWSAALAAHHIDAGSVVTERNATLQGLVKKNWRHRSSVRAQNQSQYSKSQESPVNCRFDCPKIELYCFWHWFTVPPVLNQEIAVINMQ